MIPAQFRAKSQFNDDRWKVLVDNCKAVVPTSPNPVVMEIGCQHCGNIAWIATTYPSAICIGFDRFEDGLTEQHQNDRGLGNNYRVGAQASCFAETRAWLDGLGLARVKLIAGDVRQTLQPVQHEPVALAIVDVNLYEPTLCALRWLRTRMLVGGRILVDDVDFDGVRQAVGDSGLPWEQAGHIGIIQK